MVSTMRSLMVFGWNLIKSFGEKRERITATDLTVCEVEHCLIFFPFVRYAMLILHGRRIKFVRNRSPRLPVRPDQSWHWNQAKDQDISCILLVIFLAPLRVNPPTPQVRESNEGDGRHSLASFKSFIVREGGTVRCESPVNNDTSLQVVSSFTLCFLGVFCNSYNMRILISRELPSLDGWSVHRHHHKHTHTHNKNISTQWACRDNNQKVLLDTNIYKQ